MNEIKLTIDGQEYICRPVEDEKTEKAAAAERTRTGYERAGQDENYYRNIDDRVDVYCEYNIEVGNRHYNTGNYYNNRIIAENICRAETLMRCMRQWQALNDKAVDWKDCTLCKFLIYYSYDEKEIRVDFAKKTREFGQIYFSSKEKARAAIDVFHDELVWYFTEYRQRLDEARG